MNEFSVGVLFLMEYHHLVADRLNDAAPRGFVKNLNNKWSVLFLEDEWLKNIETINWLLDLSKEVPLMYLFHSEEEGWEYHIFDGGADVAAAQISYGLENSLLMQIAEERYPGEDAISILDTLYEELDESGSYATTVAEKLQRKNVDVFRAFDINGIEELDELLDVDTILSEDCLLVELINQFREILNIYEFCWMSYQTVEAPGII